MKAALQAALRRMQKRAHGDRGFTLIELLVVVVILGVLVAIAIPVYMNYTKGAADKAAQSDVRSAITTVENFYTMKGKYPDSAPDNKKTFVLKLATADTTEKVNVSEGTTLSYVKESSGYLICAKNSGGNDDGVYLYNSAEGGSVAKKTGISETTCK
ncbi:hypothetical protein GCM10010466_15340 [Planomonospora alba]|uniref:Prepilin-type N-terminal cleavage/methylation domain-containing protein n=1 Tax=Planomonospora alba TaxID=161354 RepID=A0ABP6MTJ6_9ACTN